MMRRREYPLQCHEVREGLSAMLDGETDDVESAALLRHLEECDECASYDRGLRHLHTCLHDELTGACDADALWARVRNGIDVEETRRASVARAAWPRPLARARAWAASAMAAVLLIGVIFTAWPQLRPAPKDMPVIAETVRDFETFRLRGELLDVAAREPDAVREWIAERVDFKLPEDVNPPAGFKIAGGRLCSFLNRRLAFFHYEKGSSGLSLYVMKGAGLTLPERSGPDSVFSVKGLAASAWRSGDLVYVVVSDLPAEEITAFTSRLTGRAAAPPGTRL